MGSVCSPVAEWLALPRFAGDAEERLVLARLAAVVDVFLLPADLLLEALRDRLLDLVVGERNMRMDRVEWKASKGTVRVHDPHLLIVVQRILAGGRALNWVTAARFLIT